MSKLNITLACGSYDRTWALESGRVQPEGINLNYIPLQPEEIFWRMMVHGEFDASEFSLGAMSILIGQGDRRFVGIPVFTSRFFRHSSVFVNVESKISCPEELKGKKVGVPDYTMTANTWIRGFLQHDYNVKPTDIKWISGGLNEPGRKQRIATKPVQGLELTQTNEGTLSEMLENGEIDALIGAREPDCFRNGSTKVSRLFPDYKKVEVEYYRRTGVFPIMHLVVIKREIFEEHPWIAYSLYKVFDLSKKICAQEMSMQSALRYMLPWMIPELEETIHVLGEDYWSYGFEKNRKVIKTFIEYQVEQGLVESAYKAEEIFAPETIDIARI
jgi:4,5-dihydroxyphthalate decarboxylase